MMKREQVLGAIYGAITRVNAMRDSDDLLDCKEDTPLYGRDGKLDSLGLVSLVMDVEQTISQESGDAVVLADERAIAQSRSPFRDVGTFADFVIQRLNGIES